MEFKKYRKSFRHFLSIPFIWMMIIPVIILDIMLFFYQNTAMRLYEIPRAQRNHYVILDRQKLSYLNWFEKLNCAYCGYANGMFAYALEVAARTEKYWCGIKHSKQNRKYHVHEHHKTFLEYGDEEAYRKL